MVSLPVHEVTFRETISLLAPSAGVERDDNKFTTADLPNPAEQLFAMNVHAIPDRDHLIRYPQGMWSGKSVASDDDFRHISGWGSNPTFPNPQDMKAIMQMGQRFQELSAHIPNILEAERELHGPLVENPYTTRGRNDAGRENARMHDIRVMYEQNKRNGAPRHSLLHLQSRANAIALREDRKLQQKEAIAGFSKNKFVHVGTNRFAWQTSVVPGHPLYTKGNSWKRQVATNQDYLNLNPPTGLKPMPKQMIIST